MKIKPQGQYKIGIDIGGTKIKGVLFNNKKIIKSTRALTPNTNIKLERAIIDIVKKLKPKKEIFLIGVGAAGIIKDKTLLLAPNISGVKNFNFKKIFGNNTSLYINNDARCFLKGEITLGYNKNTKTAFGIMIGTGIGRAFAKKGAVQKIKKFESPELWEKKFQQIKKKKGNALLLHFLGQKLSLLLKEYNPEIIIIGGGVLKRKNFFNALRLELKKRGVKGKIYSSKLKDNSVAIGSVIN